MIPTPQHRPKRVTTITLNAEKAKPATTDAALLREPGGCVLDAQGNTLGEFEDLYQTTTIVATATEELAREVIDALASGGVLDRSPGRRRSYRVVVAALTWLWYRTRASAR